MVARILFIIGWFFSASLIAIQPITEISRKSETKKIFSQTQNLQITPDDDYDLQLVNETYKKSPYIFVPTAGIHPEILNRISERIQKTIAPNYEAKIVPVQSEKWRDCIQKIKCLPVATIEISAKESSLNTLKKTPDSIDVLLLIYPKDYQNLLIDPFVSDIPITFVGCTRRLTMFYYPNLPQEPTPVKAIALYLLESGQEIDRN